MPSLSITVVLRTGRQKTDRMAFVIFIDQRETDRIAFVIFFSIPVGVDKYPALDQAHLLKRSVAQYPVQLPIVTEHEVLHGKRLQLWKVHAAEVDLQ